MLRGGFYGHVQGKYSRSCRYGGGVGETCGEEVTGEKKNIQGVWQRDDLKDALEGGKLIRVNGIRNSPTAGKGGGGGKMPSLQEADTEFEAGQPTSYNKKLKEVGKGGRIREQKGGGPRRGIESKKES